MSLRLALRKRDYFGRSGDPEVAANFAIRDLNHISGLNHIFVIWDLGFGTRVTFWDSRLGIRDSGLKSHLRDLGFRIRDSNHFFGIHDSGFGIWDSGLGRPILRFGIRDSGFRFWDSRFGIPGWEGPSSDSGFGIRDSGFGIRDSGFGIRDSGFGIRDSGFGIRDSGLGSSHPQIRDSGFGIRARFTFSTSFSGSRLFGRHLCQSMQGHTTCNADTARIQ